MSDFQHNKPFTSASGLDLPAPKKKPEPKTRLQKLTEDIVPLAFSVALAILVLALCLGLSVRLFLWTAGWQ